MRGNPVKTTGVSGVVAIVGRPNVGKSALFNRIARRRVAIVHDRPGVTRDRLSAEVEWQGRPFMLVDTGGIGLLKGEQGGDDFAQEIVTQVQVALDDVDVILFVVSVQDGVLPMDLEVSAMLRAADKPVLLIINKVDTAVHDRGVDVFSELGFEYAFPVSALHDRGIDIRQGCKAIGRMVFGHVRPAHHHRDSRGFIIKRHLGPHSPVAVVVSMVAGINHQRVIRLTRLI